MCSPSTIQLHKASGQSTPGCHNNIRHASLNIRCHNSWVTVVFADKYGFAYLVLLNIISLPEEILDDVIPLSTKQLPDIVLDPRYWDRANGIMEKLCTKQVCKHK